MAKAGAVWIDVLPNMAGFNTAIRAQMGASLAGTGEVAGKSYTTGLLRVLKGGLGGMRAEVGAAARGAAAAAAAAVEEASVKVRAARAKEETAAGKVRVAELKLQELRAKDNASASSLAAAEERLAVAKRGLSTATEGVVGAERAERVAHERSTVAAREAAVASETSGGGFVRMGRRVEGAANGMTSKIGHLAKGAVAMGGVFAGIEVAKFAGESVKAAQEFQKGSNVLVTAAGESTKNLGMVRKGLLNISSTTGTSLDQMTEGMYTVEKAGYRGKAGLSIMAAAAKGAKDEGADLGTVTNALTSIMYTSNGKITNASKAMNGLMVAAGHSKTTLQDFAGSLSSVLPVSSKLGIGFDQVSGALGTMTASGMSAQQASQNLNHVITSLAAPNRVAANEMQAFGISAEDVRDNLGKRGLQGTIEMLSNAIKGKLGPNATRMLNDMKKLPGPAQDLFKQFQDGTITLTQYGSKVDKLKGVSQAQKDEMIKAVPAARGYAQSMKNMTGGIVGLNTSMMLTGKSSKGFEEKTKDVGKAVNSTADFTKKWGMSSQTASVSLSIAKQTISNVGTELALKFMPAVAKGATYFAHFVTQATNFTTANWSWIKWVAAAFAGFLVTMKLVTFATRAWNTVTTIATGVQRAYAAAQWLVNAAMDANPITLVVIAIAALAAGFVIAYKKSATFRAIVNGALGAVKSAASTVVHWFSTSFVPFFTKTIPHAFQSVLDWAKGHWKLILGILTLPIGGAYLIIWQYWGKIEGLFSACWNWVKGKFAKAWGGVKHILSGAVDAGRRAIDSTISSIKHGFSAAWSWASNAFRKSWNGWQTLLSYPVRWAKDGINREITGTKRIFNDAWSWASGTFRRAWAGWQSLMSKPVSLAKQAINNDITLTKHIFSNLWGWVSGAFKREWNGLEYIATHPISAAKKTLGTLLSGIRKAFSSAVTAIGRAWDGLKAKAKAPVAFVVNSVVRPFVSGFNKIGSPFHVHIPEPAKMYTGGYTGQGAKYQSKGIIEVHGNEYVQPSEAVTREGVPAMRALHEGRATIVPKDGVRGFADGGHVSDGLSKIIKTVGYALAQVGKPYVWGAAGPEAFDCSGLTSAAWWHGAGLRIPHLAQAQHDNVGFPVSRSNLFPGDLVFPTMTPGGHIPHVEMYVGDGDVVEAMNPHLGIRGPHPMNGFAGGAVRPELFATATSKNEGSVLGALGHAIAVAIKKGGSFLGSIGAELFNPIKHLVDKPLGVLAHLFPFPWATKVLPGAVKKVASGAIDWAGNKIESAFSFGGGGSSGGGGSVPKGLTGSARAMVPEIADSFGVANQTSAIDWIFEHESGFNVHATNPLSGAYGIPQALPGYKMASMGPKWHDDAATQEAWGIKYMIDRYGSPNAAQAFWKRHHWYLNGTDNAAAGPAWLSEDGRPELVIGRQQRIMRGGEQVLNAQQTRQVLSGGGPSAGDLETAVRKGMHGAKLALEVGGKRVLADLVIDNIEARMGAGVAGVVG